MVRLESVLGHMLMHHCAFYSCSPDCQPSEAPAIALAYLHRQIANSIAVHVRCAYISPATTYDVDFWLLQLLGAEKKRKCYTIISLDSAHKYTPSIETARKMKKKKNRAKQQSGDDSSRANTSIRLIRTRTYNNNNSRRRKPNTQLRIVSIFTARNTQMKHLTK